MLETEILIVGGGPAGATTAKYLSIGGVDNILIQRNFGFKKPCGGGIRVDAFDEFGINRNLIKKRVNELELVYKKSKISIDISTTPIAIVDRVEFDTALRNEAKNRGSTLYEATFVSLEVFEDYVISKIKKNDKLLEIKSKYVIAADGVNSKLRKQVTGEEVSSFMTHYCDIISQKYTSCTFHVGEKVAQQNYAWAFPHADGSNIGVVADSVCLEQLKIDLNIDEKTKDLGYKIPTYHNTVFYKNRVFFVGDSASQVLPFTYEGIYYAMGSAKILANILLQKKEVMDYEVQWKAKYKKKFDTLLKLQKLFLHNDFMISIMMKLYKSKYIQNQMVQMWLGDRELEVNVAFALRVIKRLIKRKNR
jgi:geranylgeranyl reductase